MHMFEYDANSLFDDHDAYQDDFLMFFIFVFLLPM